MKIGPALLKGNDGCDKGLDLAYLSRQQTLVLVNCEGGPYNFPSLVFVGTGAAGQRSFRPAEFDFQTGPDGAASTVFNANWDPATGRLTAYYKTRGLGDCGESDQYVWDGRKFRLVEASSMSECRGSYDWLTIWRARVEP